MAKKKAKSSSRKTAVKAKRRPAAKAAAKARKPPSARKKTSRPAAAKKRPAAPKTAQKRATPKKQELSSAVTSLKPPAITTLLEENMNKPRDTPETPAKDESVDIFIDKDTEEDLPELDNGEDEDDDSGPSDADDSEPDTHGSGGGEPW